MYTLAIHSMCSLTALQILCSNKRIESSNNIMKVTETRMQTFVDFSYQAVEDSVLKAII